MRQLKQLVLALAAILSLGVVAANAAQAVELKLLPEKAKFTLKSTSIKTILRTLASKEVECSSVTGAGEGSNERLGVIELHFTGCKSPIFSTKCTGLSNGTVGEITMIAEYHLRHLLSPNTADVDLVILLNSTHLSCLGILFTISGCVASDDLKSVLAGEEKLWLKGELEALFIAVFLSASSSEKGDPLVTTVDTDNSLAMESCVLLVKEAGGGNESAALETSTKVEECKTGGGAECTFLIDLTGIQ